MDETSYEIAVSLDLTGLKCPLPVLKARRQIGQMESGILEVQADDPAAPLDFEHFCDNVYVRTHSTSRPVRTCASECIDA
ncbi:MAG: sulfurtransferase TusA family protein [Candidatus Puniceispirillaceae bacterium]